MNKQQFDFVADQLSNNDLDDDETMLAFFVDEIGITDVEAKIAINQRPDFLTNPRATLDASLFDIA